MKIAVIGAGPAGIMAAAAAGSSAEVDLYDHNEKIGKKLFITGKGRCNVTNDVPVEDFLDHVSTNKKFLYSALYTFTNEMLMDLLEQNGCRLKHERGGRVFPASDKSSDILKAFERLLKKEGVHIFLNTHVTSLEIKDDVCTGIIIGNKVRSYDAVILCSGGLSYPSTGSDGSGHKIAKEAGHHITPLEPALVGLQTAEKWPAEITGLSLRNVGIKLLKDGKVCFSERGECLFTHRGLSGPVILTASSQMRAPYSGYTLVIDLKPALNEKKLDDRILRDWEKSTNKDFKNSLSNLLPKNLIPIVVRLSKIAPDKKINAVTKEERLRLVHVIKNLTLNITGPEAMRGAIVTRGGVDVDEIDSSTMESKRIKNLYFAGELIDVDALTGGFNIQIACSTGYLAGLSCTET